MRALVGAIITAGALIGLGLTALGYGLRFQHFSAAEPLNNNSGQLYGIPSMAVVLVVLLIMVGIGLGISFLGLAFHHERRYRELHGGYDTSRREMVP
jgi:hypothetical protein